MIDQQCAAKGFDAVETDIDEEYGDNTGFPLTQADEEQYMTTLADYMHGLGLGWWIKNPDDTGDSYATDMEPLADAVLTEQCNQYASCSCCRPTSAQGGVQRRVPLGRAVLSADDALGFNGARFNVALTGIRKPCQ